MPPTANGHGGYRSGSGRKPQMLPVGKDKRVLIAELAAQDTEYVVSLWSRTVRDETQALELRLACGDRLMNRAYGRPPQAVLEQQGAVVKHHYKISWLPPDPADTSRVIEPNQD
jgi:hypothetical protein